MKIPVKWLEVRDDGTAVAKVKQNNGNTMPITITIEQIHKEYPRLQNINNLSSLIGIIKKQGGMFNLPNFKAKSKRERRIENKIEERRWSQC